jgi:hypothetical protein
MFLMRSAQPIITVLDYALIVLHNLLYLRNSERLFRRNIYFNAGRR